MSTEREPVPCRGGCGQLVPDQGWRVCLACRRARRQERELAELAAAHHQAVLEDVARSVDRRTWNALRLGPAR